MKQNSQSAKIFCLVHKMDLIPEEQRDQVFQQREKELMRLAQPLGLNLECFKTSIWDETLCVPRTFSERTPQAGAPSNPVSARSPTPPPTPPRRAPGTARGRRWSTR